MEASSWERLTTGETGCIYIYIQRERERERESLNYVHIKVSVKKNSHNIRYFSLVNVFSTKPILDLSHYLFIFIYFVVYLTFLLNHKFQGG